MTRLAAALSLALTLLAQTRPDQQVFRSGVDVTTIDVTVLARNGDPVRDLKAEDFTVSVDGKPRTIVSAQFVGFSEALSTNAAAPPPRGAP